VKRTLAGLVAFTVAALAMVLVAGPAGAATPAPMHRRVIVIGIPGLLWRDISAARTPSIWRLAEAGSVGSLAVATISTATCPGSAWLTLNAGARAEIEPSRTAACPPVPVTSRQATAPQRPDTSAPGAPGPAVIRAMPAEIRFNSQFSYLPAWGVLARSVPGCATAIGPGAALALADRSGKVARYLPAVPPASRSRILLRQCPLTVVDLGALPSPQRGAARAGALRAADATVASLVDAAPAGAEIALAGLGDDASGAHLRALIVRGPGYRSGLLTAPSTRQPGVVTITDLTPTILHWLGSQSAAPALVGSVVTRTSRGALRAAVAFLIGQDTADQVTRSITGGLFLCYLGIEALLLGLVFLAVRLRAARRVSWYTAATVFCAGLPAGTFLAGLTGWMRSDHPALWLYVAGLAVAAVIAAAALAGPWRRDPFGPPGFVAAVTLAVIGIDVMTGSRLQPGAPFGLSLVEANRFYGIGNNAVGTYAAAGLICAAWAAAVVLRRRPQRRRAALAAAGAVAVAAVFVAGWPGFGAKVGGTIAMVPAFLVLLTAVARVRITPRLGLAIAVSGFAVAAAFAASDYLGLAAVSHQGEFVRQLLSGTAGSTLRRKASSNLSTLSLAWYSPIAPLIVVAAGLALGWPGRFGLRTLQEASRRSALLRPALFSVWLAVVLAWFADDSGVRVVAAALPFALPLAIGLVVRTAAPRDAPAASRSDADKLICDVPDNSVATGRTG
jgi:hypothetical protein